MSRILEWAGHIIANGMPLTLALPAALCIVFGWGREWDERARYRPWSSAAKVTGLSMVASPLVTTFLFTSLPWVLRTLSSWTPLKPIMEAVAAFYAPLTVYFLVLTLPLHGTLHDMHVDMHVYCSIRDCGFLTDWRRSHGTNEWVVITETVRLFVAYFLQVLLSFLLIRAALAVRARRFRPERP